jgi:chromate transporter
LSGSIAEWRIEHPTAPVSLGRLCAYFMRFAVTSFGSSVGLCLALQRELVEERRWVSEQDYALAFSLTDLIPGSRVYQVAGCIAYLKYGYIGAAAAVASLVLPTFIILATLAELFLRLGDQWFVHAVAYGVGPAVVALASVATFGLMREVNRRDPLLWTLAGALLLAALWQLSDIVLLLLLSGMLVMLVKSPPSRLRAPKVSLATITIAAALAMVAVQELGLRPDLFIASMKVGTSPSSTAILHDLFVRRTGMISEHTFVYALVIGSTTPGPQLPIAFAAYVFGGLPAATMATVGFMLPMFFTTFAPARWVAKEEKNPTFAAFVRGAVAASTGVAAAMVYSIAKHAITDEFGIILAVVVLFGLIQFKPPAWAVALTAAGIGIVAWLLTH